MVYKTINLNSRQQTGFEIREGYKPNRLADIKASALVYLESGLSQKAYGNLWKLIEQNPFDDSTILMARKAFLYYQLSKLGFV